MSIPQIVSTQLSEPGPGKPLLILGSSLGTLAQTLWSQVVAALGKHAHLVAWDLPGHGRSPCPDQEFTVGDLADAVADLIGRQRATGHGARGVYYAGVSLGAATGLELALRHPGSADGIAVICSGPRLGTPQGWTERAATVRAQGTAVMVEGSAQRWFAPGFLDRRPDIGSRMLADLREVDAAGYARCCAALAAYDVSAELPAITDRVLFVNGMQDSVAPPELGDAAARQISGAQSRALRGVAHQAPVEDPASVIELLLEFMDTTREATPTGSIERHDDPTRSQVYDAGLAVRMQVLGAAHVTRATAGTDSFTRDFQDLITQYAWGTIWTRPGLDRATRSAITLTALIAGGHDDELAMHIRAALTNGLSREQIGEVLLQSAIYCSVPSANTAFRIAQRVFAEIDADTSSEQKG